MGFSLPKQKHLSLYYPDSYIEKNQGCLKYQLNKHTYL